MKLQGKKIGILIEGDYYEPEIWYYKHRFAEEGVDLHFLTRMWGQTSETMVAGFKGHEYKIPFEGHVESFENMDDKTL
jgi:protease I